jgi:hypothetical protein
MRLASDTDATIEIICMARPPRIPVMLPWECLLRTSESIREKWNTLEKSAARRACGVFQRVEISRRIFALDYRVERL